MEETMRQPRNLVRSLARASVVAVLLSVNPSPAFGWSPFRVSGDVQVVAGPRSFSGTNIVWFDQSMLLPGLSALRYYVLSPAVGPKETPALTLEALSGKGVEAVELAIDTATGRQLLAVGTVSAVAEAVFGQSSSPSSSSDAAVGDSASVTTATRSGYFQTVWRDPLGIPVNSVTTKITWTYTGTYVTSYSGTDFRTAFDVNGWAETYHYRTGYFNAGHTVATYYTNDTFQTSSWFPLPTCGTSRTQYWANNVYGFGDGHVGGGVNTWAESGCAFLLSWSAHAGYS
jgi:hypothetical protein